MGRPRKSPEPKTRNEEVINTIYFAVKERVTKPERTLFPALRKRIGDLLDEVKDADQVELVCLTILADSFDFSAWKDFNWVYFEWIRDSLQVPDGAWKYALWGYRSKDSNLQETINFWLGRWYDAEEDSDKELVADARQGLEALWNTRNGVKEVKEW